MWNFTTSKPRQETPEQAPCQAKTGMAKLYGQISRSVRERGGVAAALVDSIGLDPNPTSSSDHLERGNAHLEAGCIERAIADYSRAIELDPQSAIAYNNRGVARAVAGEPRNAIADYDCSVAIDPDNACVYHNRGDAYRELGDRERAIADYTTSLGIDPTCAEAHCGRAAAHQTRKELKLALADYDKAIELDAGNAAAHCGRGRICAKRGDFDAAIASLTRAIEISPNLASAYNERGHAHLGAQNFSAAIADYGKAMELDPAIAQSLRAAELSLELRPKQPALAAASKPAKHDGMTVSFYDYLSKPSGFYYWLVPFDPAAFATRPAPLDAALKAAFGAYRKQQADGILDALEGLDQDPLVELFRGIATLTKSHGADRAEFEAQAERHFRAAADAGNEKAAAILGALLSLNLDGIPQDIPRAREFAERAARSNDAFAIRQYAVLLLSGALGSADPQRAADLMWTAAELGDPVANAMLAAFFDGGIGLEQDHAKAERYLRRAADLGLTDAQVLFGDLLLRRYLKKLSDTAEEGVRYLERALNSGNSIWAASRLAGLYGCDGRNPPWQNYQKALEYIPKFAPYSNSGYHFSLGAIYRANCDFVSSWAHYNVARYLGSNDAVERLTSLESQLTKKETQRALTLSQTIKNDLKPVPTAITLQGPGV
jgi:tetratricopeptide (TPR) repeat protein/TPR repeat protein